MDGYRIVYPPTAPARGRTSAKPSKPPKITNPLALGYLPRGSYPDYPVTPGNPFERAQSSNSTSYPTHLNQPNAPATGIFPSLARSQQYATQPFTAAVSNNQGIPMFPETPSKQLSTTPTMNPNYPSPYAAMPPNITCPEDIQIAGLNQVFRYIKKLESENQVWRERNDDIRIRLEHLAKHAQIALDGRHCGGDEESE